MQLRDLLTGGDRRSLASASIALEIAREDPEAIEELANLTRDSDPLVSMRACDVLEKLLHENPEAVLPHSQVFLEQLKNPFWETRLQCVRALGRFDWQDEERRIVIDGLREAINDENKLVRCWALDSFALLAVPDEGLLAEVEERVAEFLANGAPSMAARAREISKRLGRNATDIIRT